MKHEEGLRIQSATNKQLAEKYGVSEGIFRGWLGPYKAKIGARIGHYYNPRQVAKIYKYLGAPFIALFAFFSRLFSRSTPPDVTQHQNNFQETYTFRGDDHHFSHSGDHSSFFHHDDDPDVNDFLDKMS